MDLTAIILGVLTVNVVTFVVGCGLAAYRYRLESRADVGEGLAGPSVPTPTAG
jgi:hypothetical protein